MKSFIQAIFLLSFLSSFYKTQAQGIVISESLRSNLYILNADSSQTLADGNLVQYNNSFSADVDYFDAPKLQNIDETFGIVREGVLLSIERRPIIETNDTVVFSLTKQRHLNYVLQFIATGLNHPGLVGVLQDSYTGTAIPINLNGTTNINFTVNSSSASKVANRFMVVFGTASPQPSISSVTPVTFTSVTANQQGNAAQIAWNVEGQENIKQYLVERSLDGVDFTSITSVNATSSSTDKYSWLDQSVVSGNYFYRIESVGSAGEIIYSTTKNVAILAANQSLSIYPNPVHNGVVELSFKGMPAGIYTIVITGLSGQVYATETVNNSAPNSTQTLHLNPDVQKGICLLEAIGPDNSKTVLKVLNY